MKKQTAVDLLIDKIRSHISENGKLDAISISRFKMHAKTIQKQQIESAYRAGYTDCSLDRFSDCEKYYTSTYE
jgi:hypothetical protein